MLRELRPDLVGLTWDNTNPYVPAGLGPSVRVDYIHVGAPAGPGGIGTTRTTSSTPPAVP